MVGEAMIKERIERHPAFRVVGIKETVNVIEAEHEPRIPQIWKELASNGELEQISSLENQEPHGMLGVCADLDEESGVMNYYAAAASDAPAPEGMAVLEIEANTWAIFEAAGDMPDAIQNTWRKIFTEWLPVADYAYANAPQLEIYPKGKNLSEDCKCEVWIPVVKKRA